MRSPLCRARTGPAVATGLLPLLLIAFLIAGCDRSQAPALAQIDRVEPEIVEPGESIRLRGSGFIEGPATAIFAGVFKPNGLAAPERRSVELHGRATSSELVEIPVSPQAMEQLARERTRFEGSVELSFTTAAMVEGLEIVARREAVAFDIQPTGGGVVLAAERTREATRFLGGFGLSLSGAPADDGLVVSRVHAGSPADQAEVATGDRLLSIDGLALSDPAEIAGIEKAARHRFAFLTGANAIREVTLDPLPRAALDSDEFTAIVLSSIALGLFLAFAAPGSRRFAPPGPGPADPVQKAVGLGAVSVALAAVPAGAILFRSGLAVPVLAAALALLGLAGATLFRPGKPIGRAARFACHLLPLPAIIAVATASGSAFGLFDAVASQQATPWGWHAWSSPFALAAVIGAVALLWPADGGAEPASGIEAASTWAAAAPAAFLLSAYCLGGWLVPGVPVERVASSAWLLALGSLLCAAKSWAVLVVARRLAGAGLRERRSDRAAGRQLLIRFALLAIAIASAIAWVWADPPEAYRVTGQILATAAFVTFFTSLAVAGLKAGVVRAGQSA